MHKTIKNHIQNIIQLTHDILNRKINRKETNIYVRQNSETANIQNIILHIL